MSRNQEAEEREGGVLEVMATVPETAQLVWWILGFGEYVEVLEPTSLRDDMRRSAETMALRYRAEDPA